MRSRAAFAALAALAALAPVLKHRRPAVIPAGVRQAVPHRARGVVHVHTAASSDGHGSVEDVARAARSAGLDFVVVTDHNTEASLGIDGYRHGVLVLGGLEKSTDAGHALALGLQELPFRLDGDAATVVRDVSDLGGFVVVAHPTSPHRESRWTATLDGAAGVEVLNLGEPDVWPARGPGLLPSLVKYVVDPQGALLANLRFTRAPLTLWDRSLSERPLAGLLGTDAHDGFLAGPIWVPIPSYRQIFRFASQHVVLDAGLSGDAAHDRALVLDALRRGRGYVALDALADASGFLLEARSGEHRGIMGEAVALEGLAEIRAEADAPAGTTLILSRNGEPVARGERIDFTTDRPGAYRVEARLDPRLSREAARLPWILSNPVYVFPAAELAARDARARPPEPREILDGASGAAAVVDPAAPAGAWVADRSADARIRVGVEDAALRVDFSLGAGPHTHVAVADTTARDLSPYTALVLRAKADRRMRFDVQLRIDDAGKPGGVRIWRRSLRAETDWRRLIVPLGALKTYDRRGGRPDLRRVCGVYVELDEAMLRPGSAGTLWIADPGFAR